MYEENYEKLISQLNVKEDSLTHNFNKNSPMLPFQTRNPERPKFKNGFKSIIGEIARLECYLKFTNNINSEDIVINILNKKNVEVDDGIESDLKELIGSFILTDSHELKIFEPHLFLYMPKKGNSEEKGEEKVAKFLTDVLFTEEFNLTSYFENKESKHIIIKMILENLTVLEKDDAKHTNYIPKLDYIQKNFENDMTFALENKDFLIENIEEIFAYYYFYYITQLSVKLAQEHVDLNKNEKFYYLLDWEKPAKIRKSTTQGYQGIKHVNRQLLSRIHLIEQVNTLLGTHGLIYSEMIEHVENLNENDRSEFLTYFKKWVAQYRQIQGLDEIELKDDFKELYKTLFESFKDKKAIDDSQKSRYALCLEELGKKYFLKNRGPYGFMLNMTEDMLIMITSLCIKKPKIKLNELWEEYEKRGIFFDDSSKQKIVELFTNLNLIDKKSDSGDAQYVKKIL